MKLITNWKTAFIVLSVFACTMVLLPGFTAKAIAADTTTQSNTSAEAAGAGKAGAAGGEAVFAGLSAGTITLGVLISIGVLIQVLLSSSGSSASTSHH
jgi:hypothetical protein